MSLAKHRHKQSTCCYTTAHCDWQNLSDSISGTSMARRMIQAKIQSEISDPQGVFFHEQRKTVRPLAMGRGIRPSRDGMRSTDPKQEGVLACWPGAGQWVSRGQVGSRAVLYKLSPVFLSWSSAMDVSSPLSQCFEASLQPWVSKTLQGSSKPYFISSLVLVGLQTSGLQISIWSNDTKSSGFLALVSR